MGGEPSNFLKLNNLPKNLGLELIDSVLSSHHKLFKIVRNILSHSHFRVIFIYFNLFKAS
jgi:hypothetical protein